MTTDAIYKERGSDWSHQVSSVGTTRWLQCDQTLPLSAKGVACESHQHANRSVVDLPYDIIMESSCWERALYRNQVSYPPIHLQRLAAWPWRWDGQRQHGGRHGSCPSLVPPADEAASSSEWLHQAPSFWGLLIVWSLPGKKGVRGGRCYKDHTAQIIWTTYWWFKILFCDLLLASKQAMLPATNKIRNKHRHVPAFFSLISSPGRRYHNHEISQI